MKKVAVIVGLLVFIIILCSCTFSSESQYDETIESLKENLELSKEQYHNANDIVFKEDHVSDIPAVIAEYTGIYDDKEYKYMTVVFQSEREVLQIEFVSIDQQGIDDFQKVLDSISLIK